MDDEIPDEIKKMICQYRADAQTRYEQYMLEEAKRIEQQREKARLFLEAFQPFIPEPVRQYAVYGWENPDRHERAVVIDIPGLPRMAIMTITIEGDFRILLNSTCFFGVARDKTNESWRWHGTFADALLEAADRKRPNPD